MKLKIKPQALIALAFVFLMAGSTFAFALLNAFKNPEEDIQIPNQRIIDFKLNEQQRSFLLQRGYTLIEYQYYNGCLECGSIKSNLEGWTQNSDNQIFLQELVSDQDSIHSVTITSLRGQKSINNPTNEDIQTNICNLIINRPLWCVTSRI